MHFECAVMLNNWDLLSFMLLISEIVVSVPLLDFCLQGTVAEVAFTKRENFIVQHTLMLC